MDALLRAEAVCRRFGERRVLQSASLWARPGRIAVLLGRNGCGKTTLLEIAAGRQRPDSGAVHYDGECWPRARHAQLARRGLFLLPARDLLPWGYTLERLLRWAEHTWRTGRAAEATELLRLQTLLPAEPHELSGGERRRAEAAIAFIRAPRCLLADEPFGGIAPLDVELLTGILRRLAADGCALVVTGHEVASVLELADDVIWMAGGTTHLLGSPAQARAHFQFQREYLGSTG